MCGNSQPAPSSSGTTISELPDWAKGYAKDTLAKAGQLTDINKNPYKTYEGQRNAPLAPMQMQAMQSASDMSAGPEAFSKGVSGYMSPYMQNVVDIGKREAARQSGIMGTQQQAQAAQAGAFGGSRDAIQRAERERNLSQQMEDIQSKGMQSAYDQAANQFRQGITQGMDINKLQAGYGGMQQAQAQRELDTRYGDFTNQMNYPYKQLGFMSDMIRGLPVGTSSATTQYQAPGSMLGQLGGLGVTALGLSRFMADGGQVQGYAGGGAISAGEDVENESNIAAIIHKLPDAELQKAAQAAAQRGDKEELRLIEDEMAMRASLKNGVASVVPSSMMGMAEQDVPAGANGGIVAFGDGGSPLSRWLEEKYKNMRAEGDRVALEKELRQKYGRLGGTFGGLREQSDTDYETNQKIYDALNSGKLTIDQLRAIKSSGAAGLPAPVSTATPQKFTGDSGFKEYVPPGQRKDQATAPAAGGGGGNRPSAAISDNLHPAIAATVDKALKDMAASGKVDSGSLQDNMKSMYDMISQGNGDMLQSLKDQITQGDQQVDEAKGHALGNILMAFGANWAANASKPGAQFLSSAAASAPAAQQEMASQDKILRDMRDTQNKIKTDFTKFQISLKKDDQKTALMAAQEMAKNKLLADQLAEQAAWHGGSLAIEAQKTSIMAEEAKNTAAYRMKSLGIQAGAQSLANRKMDIYEKDAAAREQANKVRLSAVAASAADKFNKDFGYKLREYQKTMGPLQADQRYKAERNAYITENMGPYLSGGAGISSTSRYPSADSLLD